jgi:hypothetical protein
MTTATLVLLALLALVACGTPAPTATPTFRKYTVDEVVTALTPLGITDVHFTPRAPEALGPNVATDQRDFTIPSVAPKGGQVLFFDEPADVAAMVAWYAMFPQFAPYVYTNGNVLVQLNSGLAKAEADRFKAAVAAMR